MYVCFTIVCVYVCMCVHYIYYLNVPVTPRASGARASRLIIDASVFTKERAAVSRPVTDVTIAAVLVKILAVYFFVIMRALHPRMTTHTHAQHTQQRNQPPQEVVHRHCTTVGCTCELSGKNVRRTRVGWGKTDNFKTEDKVVFVFTEPKKHDTIDNNKNGN